jgi:hypothetical protein
VLQLAFRVLVEAANPDIADAMPLHDASLTQSVRKKSMTFDQQFPVSPYQGVIFQILMKLGADSRVLPTATSVSASKLAGLKRGASDSYV